MASYHMLAAGLCLVIVCAPELGLSAPVEGEEEPQSNAFDEYLDRTQTEGIRTELLATTTTSPVPETDAANDMTDHQTTDSEPPSSSKITSPSTAVMLPNSTTSTSQNVTKAANVSANSTESTFTTTSSNTSTRTDAGETEGTAPDEDKSTGENEKGPAIIEKKDGEYRFWWSDSTWLSVVIPISVGLVSALLLICWICCFRWLCCRRCGRGRSFYKKNLARSPTGSAKKALREDFRQLRAKDRMKLLAESSDEEF